MDERLTVTPYLEPILPSGVDHTKYWDEIPHFDLGIWEQNIRHLEDFISKHGSTEPAQRLLRSIWPVGSTSTQRVIERVRAVQGSPHIKNLVRSNNHFPFPQSAEPFIFPGLLEVVSKQSSDFIPLSTDHGTDFYLLKSLGEVGLDLSKLLVIVFDKHFDADISRPLPEKANWIRHALNLGVGSVEIVGIPPQLAHQITDVRFGEAVEILMSRYKIGIDKAVELFYSTLGSLPFNSHVLHKFKDRLAISTAYCNDHGVIKESSLQNALEGILQRAKTKGLETLFLSVDVDCINGWQDSVTASPYNHMGGVVRMGSVPIRSPHNLKDSRSYSQPDVRESELFSIFDREHIIKGKSFSPALMVGPGGFRSRQLVSAIRFLKNTALKERISFGVRLGKTSLPGSVSEIQGPDLRGNTMIAVQEITRAMID